MKKHIFGPQRRARKVISMKITKNTTTCFNCPEKHYPVVLFFRAIQALYEPCTAFMVPEDKNDLQNKVRKT